jgi:hypothetical protein
MKQYLRFRFARFALVFMLFQPSSPQETINPDEIESDEEKRYQGIRCPECKWKPNATSLWYCGDCVYPEGFFDGCGMEWNTFDTGGKCPGCGHQWRWTSCLSCFVWSRHDDWYADEPAN